MKFLILVALCASPAFARRLPFIVGGQDVSPPGKWPHQASVEFFDRHNCGASLISATKLTCAAHCLSSAPSSYTVVLGMHDKDTRQEGNPTPIDVDSYSRHPGWIRDGSLGFPNDAAVITLASPADTSDQFISTISMAPADSGSGPDYLNSTCYISGWGRLYGFGPSPNVLQEAQVDIFSEEECTEVWGDRIQRYHVCLGDKQGASKGACNGDSGGPLVCQSGGSWILVGITSWGRGGCSTAYPSVYARVSYFREWIDQQ